MLRLNAIKNTKIIFGAVIIIGLARCDYSKQSKSLINVQIIDNKGNPRIKEDDFVALNYTVKTTSGQTIYSNYNHILFRGRSNFKGDLFSSLGMLGEGDSAIVKVSIDSLIAIKQTLPQEVKGKYLVYYIRINKVVTRVGSPGHISDSLLNAAIENCRLHEVDNDKKREEGLLKQYIAGSGLKFNVTPSGLYYVINKMGSGPKPCAGDLSQIYFTGKYVDGELFFTNNKVAAQKAGVYDPNRNYAPLPMYIGKHLFISGLEEGLLFMPGGTKATLVIPSKLSNGEKYGYVPLICQIEVLNIRRVRPGEKIKMLHGDDDGESEVR